MLFLLGYPVLKMKIVQDAEVRENMQEANTERSSNSLSSVDVSVQLWHACSLLAPPDISLVVRVDTAKRKISLRLRNSNRDERFRWQDWVDAAMGYFKGFEERDDGDWGCNRQIARRDLRKVMLEVSLLCLNRQGIEEVTKKTGIARMWTGWLPFDVIIGKFEFDQWLTACEVNLIVAQGAKERMETENEVLRVERVLDRIILKEDEKM